jgi:hypothetical protein
MRGVVLDDLAPPRHDGERHFFLILLRHNLLQALFGRFKKRQGFVPERL